MKCLIPIDMHTKTSRRSQTIELERNGNRNTGTTRSRQCVIDISSQFAEGNRENHFLRCKCGRNAGP